MKPSSVVILGTKYTIEYKDNPAEVDIRRRVSLWGQVDYWACSIRIYDNDRPESEIWETLIHEVLHVIVTSLKIHTLESDEAHDDISLLSLGLSDTLFRNDWMRE